MTGEQGAAMVMNETIALINLDRSVDRLHRFRADNAHLPNLRRFAAFDAATLDRAACVRDGLITPDNAYTMPALGCSLSHVALWRVCADSGRTLTICEDDAVLHRHFLAWQARILSTLPADWDVMQWGWNLDWPMLVELAPGIPPGLLKFRDAAPLPDFARFQSARIRPQAVRLRSSAGAACYTLSPAGATRLLARCLPLGSLPAIWAEDPSVRWENTAVDVEMARHYADLRAFVCVPPLAISPNDHAQSTLRGPMITRQHGAGGGREQILTNA
jgi:GR25 family glycosyltransferase involved in LPS biosynthesis